MFFMIRFTILNILNFHTNFNKIIPKKWKKLTGVGCTRPLPDQWGGTMYNGYQSIFKINHRSPVTLLLGIDKKLAKLMSSVGRVDYSKN